MKTRQDLYIYVNTKIQDIEIDSNTQEISPHNIILYHHTLEIFKGKNEEFKIYIGKYQWKYYEGHTMHCHMWWSWYFPAIGEYRELYDSIQELFEKNTIKYKYFLQRYSNHISTDFKKILEYLCDFKKEWQKIQTLF